MRDARPRRHAMATRGGDKQEPDAPLPSFPHGADRSCLPLALGGEGRVKGAAGATSSLWVRPPSPFDSACAVRPPLSLILSPGWGEESGKGDARRVSLPPCNGHARG